MNIKRRCQKLQCTASLVGYSDGGKPSFRSRTWPSVTCPPQIPRKLAWVWSGPPRWMPEPHRYDYIATLLPCYLAALQHCYIAKLLHCYTESVQSQFATAAAVIIAVRLSVSTTQQNHNEYTNIRLWRIELLSQSVNQSVSQSVSWLAN